MLRISFLLPFLLCAPCGASDFFTITVVDAETGRGVPLVELKTTSQVAVYTDSNGVIAWNEPGLMDRKVYFEIRSHGYHFPGGGTALTTTRGAKAQLKINRLNIAERLYRITGQGIYRDSVLSGLPVPLRNPLLNAEITGQDTVFAVPYRGRLYWVWDDTSRAAGPLGSLAGCGATSELPGKGGLDPGAGVNLDYFTRESGFCKPITPIPGPGMKWKYWLLTVPDESGRERLLASYRSMKNLGVALESGLALFNDEKQEFERIARYSADSGTGIPMHPFRASAGGITRFYFAGPLPLTRAPAEFKALAEPAAYEGFTCLAAGSRFSKTDAKVERTSSGAPVYAWKKGTLPLTFDQEKELTQAGKLKSGEGLHQLRDIVKGAPLKPHAGSVFWNDFRRRWVMIVEQDGGSTNNGEIWYAEADTPAGPWVYAVKVVSHDRYTFYNPTQHPFFDQDGGRLIYFEGTYSNTFSGNPSRTPWYDYNQIMYRLALDDARLFLPAPVYRLRDGRYALREQVEAARAWNDVVEIPFFGLPLGRAREGTISIGGLFYALPAAPSAREETFDGAWSCKVDGDEMSLLLRMAGGKISGSIDNAAIAKASRQGLTLAFDTFIDEVGYRVSLKLTSGIITGQWRSDSENGTLCCERKEVTDWKNSPDLVPLYTDRRAGGSVAYSTAAQSGAPIALVWRNPLSVVALDHDAAPLP